MREAFADLVSALVEADDDLEIEWVDASDHDEDGQAAMVVHVRLEDLLFEWGHQSPSSTFATVTCRLRTRLEDCDVSALLRLLTWNQALREAGNAGFAVDSNTEEVVFIQNFSLVGPETVEKILDLLHGIVASPCIPDGARDETLGVLTLSEAASLA